MFVRSSRSLAVRRGRLALAILATVLLTFTCREITAPNLTPGSASKRLLNPSGVVVVTPGSMHGWAFYDDQHDAACVDASVCRMVQGPGTTPLGAGSAELATPAQGDGNALILNDYAGTRLDSITSLNYSTYRQSTDAGSNLAIALQFNVDYDLDDASVGWQGRIVFEPYQGIGGNVPVNTWQTWDAKSGKWWGTKASVPKNGIMIANPCVQASPCTWSMLLAAFPNIGIHSQYGAIVLKAGSSWAGFRGNADKLTIGVGGATTTFDFEEANSNASVPALPPDSIAAIVTDATQFIPLDGSAAEAAVHRSVISVQFEDTVSQATRAAIIGSVGGIVVGGEPATPGGDGPYFIQVADDSTGERNLVLGYRLNTLPTVVAAYALSTISADSAVATGGQPTELDGLRGHSTRRRYRRPTTIGHWK